MNAFSYFSSDEWNGKIFRNLCEKIQADNLIRSFRIGYFPLDAFASRNYVERAQQIQLKMQIHLQQSPPFDVDRDAFSSERVESFRQAAN